MMKQVIQSWRVAIGWRLSQLLVFFCALSLAIAPVHAQSLALIRDAETERLLRSYTDPILIAAGLDPKAVRLYIINDRTINAFVAEGQNIFIHTGLIMELEKPNQLIGVIAHETGHISGGHLTRRKEAIEDATVPYIISMLLGVAAIAAGSPDAGVGIMAGGSQVAQRSILAFTRQQESSADQAGMTFLDKTGQSGRGMLETFEGFAESEILVSRKQDPFARTHPMSRERFAALQERVESSPYANKEDSPQSKRAYALVRAKLFGFMERPDITLRRFPTKDQSEPARYARAIAYYRTPDFDRALIELTSLLRDDPDNPYYYELMGQILTEMGKPREGIAPYRRSVALLPDEPLLRVSLAGTLIATEDPSYLAEAKRELLASLRDDMRNPMAWRYLSMAEEQLGNHGLANLAAAEQNYVIRNYGRALDFAQRAKHDLREGSVEWQRAIDIIATAEANAGEGRIRRN